MDGWVDGWMDGGREGVSGWMDGWVGGWMVDGWMDGWMEGGRDGWMDEGLLFFIELLLHSSTSSLRHLFSQLLLFSGQPLFWATSALS